MWRYEEELKKMLNIKYSHDTSIRVRVDNDYHIKGSFDPDAPSDLDYFGYRETDFEVTHVYVNRAPMTFVEREKFVNENIDKIEWLVQGKLDAKDD